MFRNRTACFVVVVLAIAGVITSLPAAEEAAAKPDATSSEKIVPLNPQETVLLDVEGKRVLLKAKVVLREGLLEMFACPAQTKEHESIVAVDTMAYVVHSGLLALGIEPGKPVQYRPEFKPPSGTKIDIFVNWTDENGKQQRVPARSWIRNSISRYHDVELSALPKGIETPEDGMLRYDKKNQELVWYGEMKQEDRDKLLAMSNDKPYQEAIGKLFDMTQPREMEADWVFAGSYFEVDPATGESHYRAEGGDLICVANFPTAMIDVAAKSSSTGEELMFEPWTDRIPPVGTDVTIELIPAKADAPDKDAALK